MYNIWQMSPKEKLNSWREFRTSLDDVEYDDDCLQLITDWWKLAPLSTRVIDLYDSSSWPDPWKLIHNGLYDENAVGLGMAYTADLIGLDCKILLIQNQKESYNKLVVIVDNDFVLNYTYGTVADAKILDDCIILKTISMDELS